MDGLVGVKNDCEKLRWDLLPYKELEEVVCVVTQGARKYADNNWKRVNKHRYFAACMRHLCAWVKGERTDAESGSSHLAHASCCLLFMMWHDNNEKMEA